MHKRLCFVILFITPIGSLAKVTKETSHTVPAIHISQPSTLQLRSILGPAVNVSAKEIQNVGANSLLQALSHSTFLQVRDVVGNGSQAAISMRGFGENAVSNSLVLIDGIPIINPDLAAINLNILPINAIQNIAIIPSSESVLYGDQAVGGVINITTKQIVTNTTNLLCAAGSYQNQQCKFAWQREHNNWQYQVFLNNSETDNYRQHNHYQLQNLASFINFENNQQHLKLSLQLANEQQQYPGALTASQVFADRRQASNNTDYFRNFASLAYVNYGASLSDNWQFQLDTAYRGMEGHGVLFTAIDQSRDTYFIKPTLQHKIKAADLTLGIDAENDRYLLQGTFPTATKQQKYGIFSIITAPLTKKLAINAGMRYAQQNAFLSAGSFLNHAFATTIGMQYLLTVQSKLYLRRAASFRFPKADENNYAASNSTLKTQRGVAYETGWEWQGAHSSFIANLYRLDLRDEIAFDPMQTAMHPFGINRNLGPTRHEGYSIALQHAVTRKLKIGSQYNYVHAYYRSGNYAQNRIPLVAEHLFNANLTYFFTKHFNFYSEIVYTGSQYPANDDANRASLIGGYSITNLNVRYQNQQLALQLLINNVFNKAYYYASYYSPTFATASFYPAPERNILLSVNYNFL